MHQPTVITIDGPAGSGKSTLGEQLARQLGYLYFDTGVMYRALAFYALQQHLDLHDAECIEHLAHQIQIEVVPSTLTDGRQYTVLVNHVDVTWSLRSPDVDRSVSLVARYPGVRAELRRQQRVIGLRGCVVMVGRDIGTMVMPDASLKIYLEASLEARASRRANELHARGITVSVDQVRSDMARRDELDQHVLQPADDAHILSSDDLSPAQEVEYVVALFQQHTHPGETHR